VSESTPPPPDTSERPLSFLGAAGWTLLAAILFAGTLEGIESVHPGALGDFVTVGAAKVAACSIVLFAILRVHEPETSVRQVLALRRPALVVFFLAVLLGACLAIPATWIEELIALKFPVTPKEAEAVEHLLATPAKRWVLVVSLTIIMPVCDDLLFRGAIFTLLKRTAKLDTVVFATAALNVLMAPEWRQFPSIFVMLLAASWMRAMTASVVPSIAARITFFALLYAPAALGRDGPPTSKPVVAAALLGAAIALAGIGAVSRRDPRTLDARVDDV
jgi:hypothetical protein